MTNELTITRLGGRISGQVRNRPAGICTLLHLRRSNRAHSARFTHSRNVSGIYGMGVRGRQGGPSRCSVSLTAGSANPARSSRQPIQDLHPDRQAILRRLA